MTNFDVYDRLPMLPFEGSVEGGSLFAVVDVDPDDDVPPELPPVGVDDARLSRDAPPLGVSEVEDVFDPPLALELDELPALAAALASPVALPAAGLLVDTAVATDSILTFAAVAAALVMAAATDACWLAGKAPTAALAICVTASGCAADALETIDVARSGCAATAAATIAAISSAVFPTVFAATMLFTSSAVVAAANCAANPVGTVV